MQAPAPSQGAPKHPSRRRDWRWLAALGAAVGLAVGLAGLLTLDGRAWLPLWGLALGGLTWLGWGAEPRLASPLVPRAAPKAAGPRLVRDGPFEMVELPGGDFLMGSPDGDDMAGDDEKPQHRVRVSGLRIARTQVTAGLWREVMGGNAEPGDPELPAANLTWYQALDFCNRLSRRHGYRPCYRERGFGKRRGWVCDWRADGYRLPTEAEWEYGCRAGTSTRFGFGDDPAALGDHAWYAANSGRKTRPVATRRPNRWGLFDMHGNIWEWCWDWYGPYGAEAQTDPRGPAQGTGRVLRGGSFVYSPVRLRSAFRDIIRPEFRLQFSGFRCVRVAPPQR